MKLPGDFHVHTCMRPVDDGAEEMTPAAVAAAMRSRSFGAFGLSPHFHFDSDFGAVCAFLDAAREETRGILPMFRGVETECIDAVGSLPLSPEQARRLDYVIAAPDHYNCTGAVRPPKDRRGCLLFHQKFLIALAENPLVDVISHPWAALILLTCEGHLPGYDRIESLDAVPETWIAEFAAAARENRTAVEINGFFTGIYLRRRGETGRSYGEAYRNFYRILAAAGVMLSPGSDAHRLADLAQIDDASGWLEALNLPEAQIWRPRKRA